MVGLKLFLTIYLFGGVTFIPLLVLSLIYAHKWLNQRIEDTPSSDDADKQLLVDDVDPDFKAGEFEENKGVKVYRKGWLVVTKTYYYHHSEVAEMAAKESQEVEVRQRCQLKKRQRFFAVLKHGNLFLYRDSSHKSNLVHAISLQGSFVTIWPRDPEHELPDASMFSNRTCISILRNGTARFDGKLHLDSNPDDEENASWSQFYLYFDNNIDKEDWYFDLINVAKRDPKDETKPMSVIDPNNSARAAHLKTADALYLIQAIHSTEGQLTTKWLNALLGRLFLSLQRTDALKNYIYGRLHKKLTKLNKPGFLDDLVIEEVDVGTSTPMVTNPELLELSPSGLTRISLDMQYKGKVSVIVATKVTINLGSHFRQRQVPVQLSIKLNELRGSMFLTIKPPPSNRLWYTFQSEPVLDVDIEPVVSSSKFSYGMVTNAIKSKLAEAIKESIVVPFWDDFAFYSTEDEIYRAGIWEKYDKDLNETEHEEHHPPPESPDVHREAEIFSSDNESTISEELPPNDDPDRNHSGSISSGDLPRSKSSESLKTQDSNLKKRTLQRVENFKKAFSSKSKDNSDDDDDDDGDNEPSEDENRNNDSISGDYSGTKDSSDPKKYLKNSLRKFGKWYKGSSDDPSSTETEESVHRNGSGNHPPEMISNRRKALPKRPIPPPIDHPTSPLSVSSASFSPTLNASEMFANKSRSLSTMSSESNDSVVSPSLPSHNHGGFVKPRRVPDFSEDLFAGGLEGPRVPNDTARSNQGSRRSTSERFGPPDSSSRSDHSLEPEDPLSRDNRTIGPNDQ